MTPDTTQDRARTRVLALVALAFLFLSGLVLARLSAYGIWDPWELALADAARKLGEGAASADTLTKLPVRLIHAAFSAFSVQREWVGRLPFALSGVLLLASTGLVALRFAGARAALYALVALGTMPLFLLHSRQMLGQSPTFFASSLVLLGASAAVFPDRLGRAPSPVAAVGFLSLAGLGAVLGTLSGGVMLAVVPPLGAVALAALMVGPGQAEVRWVRGAVIATALVTAALVARVILRHEASPSWWTGGAPLDASVPTYERVLEHVFHGLGPWAALVPLALGQLMREEREGKPDQPLRLVCMLWAALAYAATTLHLSAFGPATFPAASALALAAAFWLDDRADDGRSFWPELTIALLFVGLAIRDYALYPGSPWDSLEVEGTKPPLLFNPRGPWAAVLGLFGVGLALSCMATPEERRIALGAPYRGMARAWKRSLGHKAWLVMAATLALGLLVYGTVTWIQPKDLRMTSLGIRIGRVVGLLPIALPAAIALGQVVYALSGKLSRFRHAALLVGALSVGVYTSQVFLPQVSEHFSSRGMFDTYNKLAAKGEPLAQHRVEGRAAAYYARGDVRDLATRSELIEFLAGQGRRWAAFPNDQLAEIDVAFRKRTGRHLFVPKSDNARVALVASEPVKGTADTNPLVRFVLRAAPKVQHAVNARFEDAVELVGYNLKLPQDGHVGPGQSFVIEWVWRALRANIGSYKVFVHIDSGAQRIHGDHEPVDGTYPVRLWDMGDVIVDSQTVSVPATNPPGEYTLYIGLYRGETRLKVKEGAQDGGDRVRAGTVRVQ